MKVLLQLVSLGEEAIKGLKESFNRLPHTEHKDGKYRLRRFSVIELRTSFWNAKREAEIERLPHRVFNQSEDFNKHQGGMTRDFEEIDDSVLNDKGMKAICLAFKESRGLIDGQEIEIHQMRVLTQENGMAKVAPEGIHQDGFDDLAIVGINRHNILGGELLAYESKRSSPFLNYALKDGQILMLDDSELWHNASPIVAKSNNESGYGDWFVLCVKR
jgi:hypothetical protein